MIAAITKMQSQSTAGVNAVAQAAAAASVLGYPVVVKPRRILRPGRNAQVASALPDGEASRQEIVLSRTGEEIRLGSLGGGELDGEATEPG